MKTTSKNQGEFEHNKIHSEALFYVRQEIKATWIQDELNIHRNEEAVVQNYFPSRGFQNFAIKPDEFKNLIQKVSNALAEIVELEETITPEQRENKWKNNYSLEEIEINLAIEGGANFFLTAKANAGLTLKYKKK